MIPRFEEPLVRALLRDQHADLADLPLREVDGGWDNHLWRLGDDLAVRLPRTDRAPGLLLAEQTWLPVLAVLLPLPVPVPVRVGRPSALLDRPWTVSRWVAGTPADVAPLRAVATGTLARALRCLHVPAPGGAPRSDARGIPLARHLLPEDALDEVVDDASRSRLDAVWEASLAASAWDGEPLWLHGDLHPANVVGDEDGDLVGLLDLGDLCAGDPATDLSAAWLLLPDGAAEPFLEAYGDVDEATTTRARGWAVLRAVGLLHIGRAGRLGRAGGKPTWEPAGRAALRRVLAG